MKKINNRTSCKRSDITVTTIILAGAVYIPFCPDEEISSCSKSPSKAWLNRFLYRAQCLMRISPQSLGYSHSPGTP